MSRIAWEGDEEMLRAIDEAAGRAKMSREEYVAAAVVKVLALADKGKAAKSGATAAPAES